MPDDSSGVFSLVPSYKATTGQTIAVVQHNPPLEDIATALTARILRTGVSPMLGSLNLNGFRLINVGEASNDGDAVPKAQMDAAILAGSESGFSGFTSAIADDYTVLADDNGAVLRVDATNGGLVVSKTIVITLPQASVAGDGFKLVIKKTDATVNTVTIDAYSSEKIDGQNTKILTMQNQTTALVCNGSSWSVISDGATFTSGTNANGDYLRFANGVQQVWSFTNITPVADTMTGKVVTWPIAFSDSTVPVVHVTPNTTSDNVRTVSYGDSSNTGATVFIFRNNTTTTRIDYSAFGRWY